MLFAATTGFLLLSVEVIEGQDPVELTTLDGKTYSSASVVRVEKGAAIISHTGGIAAVNLRNLPEEFRIVNNLMPGLEEIRGIFSDAVQKWIAGFDQLNTQYEAALRSLEARCREEGDVRKADAVLEEIGSFRTVMKKEVSVFEDLAKLQTSYAGFKEKWERENSPSLVAITDSYLRELKEIVRRAMEAGDVEGAEAPRAELIRFEEVRGDADRIQILLERGPAIVRVEAAVSELSPDGDPTKKDAGIMAVVAVGPQMDVVLPVEDQFYDVVEMHGNWETWAALKKDGKLISSPLAGDGIPEDHERVVWFRVGAGVVTAFHPDGSCSVYGETQHPKDRPPADLRQITQFAHDRGSGAALDSYGKLRVWGSIYPNDQARDAMESMFETVRFVGASENIGWVVDGEGGVYTWRNNEAPEKVGQHDNIAQFSGGRSAYLVLLENGKLEGGAIRDDENPVVHVPENLRSGQSIRVNGWGYALQFEGGGWHTWGGPPESSPYHAGAKAAGSLLDLEISAAPGRFLLMMLRRG